MLTIQALALTDLPELAKMYSYYAQNTVATYCDHEVSAQYMRSLLCGVHHLCYSARDGETPIGYVHLTPMFSFSGKKYEVAIYLQPEYTGRGLGRQMVQYAEERAKEHGARQLCVSVCTENAPSLALFDSLGYTRTRVKQNAANKFARTLSTQLFEKRLHADEL